MWAPEIHWISGQSSCYYAAGISGTFDGQYLHVLKGSSTDIWESTWSYAGRIAIPNRDVLAIDATVLFLSTGPYLVFSSWDGDDVSGFLIALVYITNYSTVYSASNCASTGYSLGRIELTGSDPLSASSWTKYDNGPVFQAANGNYAPGHNRFFTAIYIVYHASPSSTITCDGNRRTMVQAVGWHTDGTPNLSDPRALTDNVPEPA
ncbi:alpha-N-arabinofuranosidase [Rhizoctonia solani]|uniref:Alpha-N-arabinofuranosidase n=1 Tax=Rhizoctonia solani TaxID=456999 RepID=A0A0K6G3G9_9AGAM|nr:alpha-N-arabinofuranosidase [Rhizoctonia solani]